MFYEMLVKYVLERMHGFQKILLFATKKSKRHFPGWSIFIPKWIVLQTRFQRSNWTGQLLCSCLSKDFRGISEKDKFVAKSFLGEQLERTRSMQNYFWRSSRKEQLFPMFWRFLKTAMSLKDRIWRSNRNGQFRCKKLFKEIGGFVEKDQFVAKSCSKEPLTTSLWQSHWWRSSVKRNVVVKSF